ncbi:MAG: DUF1028 domain-containing protein, partial [Bacteroidetes bacterium]
MKYLATIFLLALTASLFSQDTFSIVAADPETGEVGSAGASCVDLNGFGLDADFLGQLFPGLGAINTQAWYSQFNQLNAANRLLAGDTPQEVIDWLVSNDVGSNPGLRQYGVVAFVEEAPQAAAHTGSSTDDWKGHLVGDNYAIQGNILLGASVLDSMEANFLNTSGSLSDKLMAALQGANLVGADARCAINGTSSLFAFLKVAQPDDEQEEPSLVLGVITADGDGVEPIDSLQTLYDEWTLVNTISPTTIKSSEVSVYPNPASDVLNFHLEGKVPASIEVINREGKLMFKITRPESNSLSVKGLTSGVYFLKLKDQKGQIF